LSNKLLQLLHTCATPPILAELCGVQGGTKAKTEVQGGAECGVLAKRGTRHGRVYVHGVIKTKLREHQSGGKVKSNILFRPSYIHVQRV
jgi:hypothetical protein